MLFNERTCSHCYETFKPRAFGINLLVKRYEFCPHCRRLTEVHYRPPADPPEEDHAAKPLSEEDSLKRKIDESKYEGL